MDLFPEDLPRLLRLLARVGLYLQDEVEVALHPTLTRVWSRAGRSGQQLVQAPGNNAKQYGLGWWTVAMARWTSSWSRGVAGAAVRSAAPRRRTLPEAWAHRHGDLGQPSASTRPKGSRLLRALLAELGEQLVLV
jgi:hypothetical protein